MLNALQIVKKGYLSHLLPEHKIVGFVNLIDGLKIVVFFLFFLNIGFSM